MKKEHNVLHAMEINVNQELHHQNAQRAEGKELQIIGKDPW